MAFFEEPGVDTRLGAYGVSSSSFFRLAQERDVGVIAMRVVARGALIERSLEIRELLLYVLTYPVSTAVVGISAVSHLEENVRMASAFEPRL